MKASQKTKAWIREAITDMTASIESEITDAYHDGVRDGQKKARKDFEKKLKSTLAQREKEVLAKAAGNAMQKCPKCSSKSDEQHALKQIQDAFDQACDGAYEGWSEAQDGHSYDCSESRDQYLKPAFKLFDAAMKLLDPSWAPNRRSDDE